MNPLTPHVEKHFESTETIRDVVIGMADGLTVPFALAAGISGAIASTQIIVTAGLAEIAAGSIAMGLGGYLAAKTDAQHYKSEYAREVYETEHMLDREKAEVREIFEAYGLSGDDLTKLVDNMAKDKTKFVDFMMRFELGLEPPVESRAMISALTIGGAYIFGGIIPLFPYMIWDTVTSALPVSIVVTATALVVFGGVKAKLTGLDPWKGSLQTLAVGGLAATVAFMVAKWIGG